MDCVNHSGVPATAYCQNCGKALCPGCVRNAAGGQILCEPCWTGWQTYQQPFVPATSSGPNPWVAAGIGVIPGVGAMYNGQFFKGLIHVVVFAVLISITEYHGIFGIFIGFWCMYQAFEAFHTAKAIRDGEPLPDPLGLNEVGNWLNLGAKPRHPGQPGANPGQPNPGTWAPGVPSQGPATGGYQQPAAGQYQAPYHGPYQQPPYTPTPGAYVDPMVPPVTPPYYGPHFWRRKEPVGAVVLIALGVIFLLDRFDVFDGRLGEFAWPLVLIGLGAWLIVRRLGDSQGGPK